MVKLSLQAFNGYVRATQRVVQRLKLALESRRSSGTPERRPEILAVLADSALAIKLRGAVEPLGWRLTVVDSLPSGIELGERSAFNIIVLEKAISENAWRDAVSRFSHLSAQPIVFLLSEHVSPGLADALAQSGGYAVLGLPLREDRLTASVYAGWRLWNNQEYLRRLTR